MPVLRGDSSARTIRIVTADDQPIFRRVAGAIIARTPGFELVGEATGGQAALDLVQDVDPDVVILDVRMPGVDGIEVASRLTAANSSTVIVLASATDSRELAERARSCGASAVVEKHWLTPRLLRGLWIAHRRR